jgi:spermidine synthase
MTLDRTDKDKPYILAVLFFLSGSTALVYEVVWIRLFAINFGSTVEAMSTVLSVYLGGLAVGAAATRRLTLRSPRKCLRFYGLAEIFTGIYAWAVPSLLRAASPLLKSLYAGGHGSIFTLTLIRATGGAATLLPATIAMGTTLPLLARWIASRQSSRPQIAAGQSLSTLYSINLAGASAGAILSGFALLPALGFTHTLTLACSANVIIGIAAWWIGGETGEEISAPEDRGPIPTVNLGLPNRVLVPVAFLSGWACLLYEVAWGRIYGLLFGPTASTLTLILAVFLVGLTAGGIWAGSLRRNLAGWLCAAEAASALALLGAILAAGASPPWIADWVRLHNASSTQIELMKLALLALTLLPLTIPLGLTFPLIMSLGGSTPERLIALPATKATDKRRGSGRPRFPSPQSPAIGPSFSAERFASWIGGIYGINIAGCIVGSIMAGWLLIPAIGTEQTVLLGGLVNLGLGLLVLNRIRPAWRKPVDAAAVAVVVAVALLFPRWDMAAMAAGGYKYAPYYATSSALHRGELLSLHEGVSGTVAVRRDGGSLLLSIDGKVDASDSGGDLLTEKLLAHLPLLLAPDAHRVCLIGLASGVTAGAALSHPLQRLDVIEVSRDVVRASHYFDGVNGRPLQDPRTTLIVNDGRNHLALTSAVYDVIISEPSNPWIAGMNSLFTRDFFRIARLRLRGQGIFAQWFHTYNMPPGDLRSLVAAFVDVFPSSILWKLNDGDILLTGFAGEANFFQHSFPNLSKAALADLARAGVENPKLLLDLYIMRDSDLRKFAGDAEPNTDDHPWLEFHGQRDLHAQTDPANEAALFAAVESPPPPPVRALRESMSPAEYLAIGRMFERAESYRSAFRAYQQAQRASFSVEALAGMDRCARLSQERAAVMAALGLAGSSDGIEQRVAQALEKGQSGQVDAARFLFEETALAHPQDAAAQFNFGLFFLEQKSYQPAIRQFRQALKLDSKYLPAYEALAESYLQLQDFAAAAEWSRRILEIDPNHPVARRTLATLEQKLNRTGH